MKLLLSTFMALSAASVVSVAGPQLASPSLTLAAVTVVSGAATRSACFEEMPQLERLTPASDLAIVATMSYPGGKNGSGVYQRIINLMPPHDVYIEPFLGSGAVMRRKRPARLNIGCDMDPEALEMAMLPAESPKPARLSGNGGSGEEVRTAGSGVNRSLIVESGVRRRRGPSGVAMVDVEASSVRSGALSSMLYPRVSSGDGARYGHHVTVTGDGACRYRFLQGDGIEFLQHHKFSGSELVYADPPYVRSVRSSIGGRDLYRFEMTDQQHRQLLTVLKRLPCPVILSGYWSKLYSNALAGWNHIKFQAMTRGGLATESLWFNFDRPVELHDYRYLGSNTRERERIKRKKNRWVAKLGHMPVLERQALLSAIASTAGNGDTRGALEMERLQG